MRVGKDLHLMIRDDGIGFDVAAAGERAVDAGTVGLLSMRERASLSGGQLDIDSELGRGTCVVADIPCGLSGA
jgi:signal transduction histidine kinase